MKKYSFSTFLFLLAIQAILFFSCKQNKEKLSVVADIKNTSKATLSRIAENYKLLLDFPLDSAGIPRSMNGGKLRLIESKNWCSGFYPGIWWMLYDHNKDSVFANEAEDWTWLIEKEKYNDNTHDMGFKVYGSFGKGYQLTKRKDFENVITKAAITLSNRFHPKVQAIRSWDTGPGHRWMFPVIIDNMMNLELLFEASKLTKDSLLYDIAVTHANTTLKNHFREDYSSYHVVDYDTITGNVNKKETYQGVSDESSWARGQGWGLYGYTLMYRETKNKIYLEHANKIAEYIISRLPKDHIPFWDFDAPNIPNAPRDVSAGALYASALLELQRYVSTQRKNEYISVAENILTELSSKRYRREPTLKAPFLLNHATGHLPGDDEIDVPIIYADYYYVEALLRASQLDLN